MQDGSTLTKIQEDLSQNSVIPNAVDSSIAVNPKTRGTTSSTSTKKFLILTLIVMVVIAGAAIARPMLVDLFSYEDTDNAYTAGHVHSVSSKIAGTVEQVLIGDNQKVQKGQLLVILDARDQQIVLAKAEAHLHKLIRDVGVSKKVISFAKSNASAAGTTASANIASANSSVEKENNVVLEAQSGVAMAEQTLSQRIAELHKTELDLQRNTLLEAAGAVATDTLDTTKRDHDVAVAAQESAKNGLQQAKSKLDEAKAQLAVSRSQLIVAKASSYQARAANFQVAVNSDQKLSSEFSVDEAKLDVDNSRLQSSYTRIISPVDGVVGRKNVEIGQRIQPGTPLLAVVSEEKWIVANFKETQLKAIRVGLPANVTIDSFGERLFKGRVDSISPASGSSFSLMPPDNATGNFTKVVQRVPVKIILEPDSLGDYKDRLVPGMSCVVKIKVR